MNVHKLPAAPSKTSAPVVTLRQRIADALTKPTTSQEVGDCLFDAQRDIARVEREIEAAKAKAVDPLATETEATDGKRAAESLGFDRDRLLESETRLKDRLAKVQTDEEQVGLRAAYDAAAAAREAILSEVKERYPKMAADLLDLVDRMTAAERQIAQANSRLPNGRERLQHVEYGLRRPGCPAQTVTFASAVQLPEMIRGAGSDFLRVSHTSWEVRL